MKNRIISFLLSLFLLVTSNCEFAVASASSSDTNSVSAAAPLSLSAKSYCLMDGDTGVVLAEKNSALRLPMASTTKIMTCILALELADLKDDVVIDPSAVGIEGSSIYLIAGETLRLEELLYALMLESANDAAVAIALHISNSVDGFAEQMNRKALELGLTDTRYCNANGLQEENHYSSARDLSVLMQYCLRNPFFAEIVGTETKVISAPNQNSRYLTNHNKLLRTYEYCIGGKTGYTKAAGRCLVSAAEQNGKQLICVTLGAPDDWNDHKALFRHGFSLYSHQEVLREMELTFSLSVVGGTTSCVTIANSSPLSLPLRKGETVETVLEAPAFLYAPVFEGECCGEAVFYSNGSEIARVALEAKEDVVFLEESPGFWERIWNQIKMWFKKWKN